MATNYLDEQRRRQNRYVNDGDAMIPESRADQLRRYISTQRPGTNYFYPQRYGSDLSLRQLAYAKRNLDQAAASDERFNRLAFKRDQVEQLGYQRDNPPTGYGYGVRPGAAPGAGAFSYPTSPRLQGTGLTDVEQRALGYNPDAPITVGPSAINPAPARQAVDQAIQGNRQLSNPGSRTVVSDNGFITTYSADGQGYSRSKVPAGTNIQRTENGHTVLQFPNGLHRIVGADGNVVDYKPQAVQDSVKDFANPVMNSEQAANYLNASRNVIPPISPDRSPSTAFNPTEGTSIDYSNPAVPIIGTAVRPAPPAAGAFGAFGVPNVGAIASNLQQGVANYLQRTRQSFVPYTKRNEDQ